MIEVVLDGGALTADEVLAVADRTARVRLGTDALDGMLASRAVVERVISDERVVYGITTGFGALATTHIEGHDVDHLQLELLRSHAAGVGDPLPDRVVRAMLLLRARTLAQGHSGVRPVIVETRMDSRFKVTPDQLAAHLTRRSRVLILNSPSNPCGIASSADELAALGEILAQYPDVVVLSDEIYEHIHWGNEPFTSFAAACPALKDRTITINGVSKAYAMTGWRIGYAAGPRKIIDAMKVVQGQSTTNPCSISQAAAVEALTGDQAPVAEMVAAYRERHDVVVNRVNEIPGFECQAGDGTFYLLPRVSQAMEALGLDTDAELAEFLIEKAGVATVPGAAFGAPGHLRLSFASSLADLEEALARIKRAVAA